MLFYLFVNEIALLQSAINVNLRIKLSGEERKTSEPLSLRTLVA